MELGKTPVEKHEHVLVGLSSSPSNRKIIEEASKLAKAFDAEFTALYVSKSQEITLPPEDAVRLQNNIRYAEDLDAAITIVIGRSDTTRKPFWKKQSITEQLIVTAPNIDIYNTRLEK